MQSIDVLKAQLSRPLVGTPGGSLTPTPIRKVSDYRPDQQSPDFKASSGWDEATRKRWTPLSELPGFVASRSDLEFLNACGMTTGNVHGIPSIRSADMGRAKGLLVARG